MFGKFGGKKKISSEIAIVVSNTIRLCFAQTEYIDRDGIFHPPYNFWLDEYIIGYVYMLSSLFIKFEFLGDTMSEKKKGEISLLSLMLICGHDWGQAWQIVKSNVLDETEYFKKGADDALPLFASMSGRLKADSTNPLLKRAKLLAEKRYKQHIEVAKIIGGATSTNSAIGMAVMELTIMQHVKDKYLLNSDG